MATPGVYISAMGHTGLLVWLLAGWGLSSEPLAFEITTVDVISGEAFDAARQRAVPTPGTAEPTAPVAPDVEAQPDLPDAQAAPVVAEAPAPTAEPVEELPPPAAPEPPAPVADVTDTMPDIAAPAIEPTPAIEAPITDAPPQQRPADRVAPTPVAPPAPDVAIDDLAQEAAEPAEAPSEDPPIAPVAEVAPPETATEIVTEADTPSGAVETSLRPAARPSRPAPAETPQEAETAEAEPADTGTSVEDVLADVVGAETTAPPDVPQGPPMTGSEREGFRVAVNKCWTVDPGSVAARVTIVVGFSLTSEGRVDGDVRQLSATGGDAGATRIAFEAARRAILRCQGAGGYDLPAEKYGQWDDVEIEFDPSGMRLR